MDSILLGILTKGEGNGTELSKEEKSAILERTIKSLEMQGYDLEMQGRAAGRIGNEKGALIYNHALTCLQVTVETVNIANFYSTGLDVSGAVQCDTLQIDQAFAAGTITATHTILIKDQDGTSWKVPCVAA